MEVTVKYMTLFRKITKKSEERFLIEKDCTLETFIKNYVCKKYKIISEYIIENGHISERVAFFINNKYTNTLESTVLENNDLISIITQIQGG